MPSSGQPQGRPSRPASHAVLGQKSTTAHEPGCGGPRYSTKHALTSELTISSGTLCTMDTVAVDRGTCCFPFLLCNLRTRQMSVGSHGQGQLRGAAPTEAPCRGTHCVRSWPHSAHKPFITTGWLHSSSRSRTALQVETARERGLHARPQPGTRSLSTAAVSEGPRVVAGEHCAGCADAMRVARKSPWSSLDRRPLPDLTCSTPLQSVPPSCGPARPLEHRGPCFDTPQPPRTFWPPGEKQ